MKIILYVRETSSDNPPVRTIERELRFAKETLADEDIINFGEPYVEYHIGGLERHLRGHVGDWLAVDMGGRNFGTAPLSVCALKTDVLAAIEEYRKTR